MFTFKNVWPLLLLLAGCSSEKPCKYKPAPVFSKDLPGVIAYNFEVQGRQSLESIQFESQVLLEILQDVCTDTRQEYRFTVPGNQYSQYPDSVWMKEAARQFVFLSTLSPRQRPLRDWADLLEERRKTMRLGEEKEVQAGITVQIDRVISPEQSTLVVVLAQKDEN